MKRRSDEGFATSGHASEPKRSPTQRLEALERANAVRTNRAALKRDLMRGRTSIQTLLKDPPDSVMTAKVFDILLAVPTFGRVKVNKVLSQCRISPSTTIGGLSQRQCEDLITRLGDADRARQPGPRRAIADDAGLLASPTECCDVSDVADNELTRGLEELLEEARQVGRLAAQAARDENFGASVPRPVSSTQLLMPLLRASIVAADAPAGGLADARTADGGGNQCAGTHRVRTSLIGDVLAMLEELADPGATPPEQTALAATHSRQLRMALERLREGDPLSVGDTADPAREAERERVRRLLQDTALQTLELIACDGFGMGLSATTIAKLAHRAAHELDRSLDGIDELAIVELVPELQLGTRPARLFHSHAEISVGHVGTPPTCEQLSAVAGAVREAITHASKNADASHFVVRVEVDEDGCVSITVTDDGINTDLESATTQPRSKGSECKTTVE